ncbi:CobQ-like glutamine amidotransferase family enzyme [Flavobacterium sp. CG_9.10]|uniref:hypothetical protein n=1 Tax=Flavobacterium sp. CG_9.10 TaxID=2787729 RepID=UPI0018CA5600|nr:hypothetical protein [Flavobacterium sp. CG_9.10]MBG6110429.1 CobQ-like glutamine amidotransferase family enzyme [Flavobacterium sp. CG_9.10]
MNNFSKQNNNNKITTIFIMVVFALFCNVSVFSQTKNEVVNTTLEVNTIAKQENTSNMNFVLWFMGSKQDPNRTITTEGINTKKQVMTSGMAPNRLLIKAFLKKAINLESTIA